ncbi:MAG: hypothetical protein M5U26_30610 [Planctomycetota bacterium]|nr:hypothetical protein [Planctomycetota bacterium]
MSSGLPSFAASLSCAISVPIEISVHSVRTRASLGFGGGSGSSITTTRFPSNRSRRRVVGKVMRASPGGL